MKAEKEDFGLGGKMLGEEVWECFGVEEVGEEK